MARRTRKARKTKSPKQTPKQVRIVAVPAGPAAQPIETRAEHTDLRETVPEIKTAKQQAETQVSMQLDAVDEAFFNEAERLERQGSDKPESFPPVAEDVAADKAPPPSPALLARRSKFRKLVGAVVALSTLFVVWGIGKTLLSGEREVAPAAAAETLGVSGSEPATQQTEEAVEEQPLSAVHRTAARNEAPKPLEQGEAVEPAGAEPPDVPEVDDPSAETLALLNRGRMTDAIPMARATIQQAPDHALGYLYLGTALQETGKHKDAIAAYSECVSKAKKGPVWECRAMGGTAQR